MDSSREFVAMRERAGQGSRERKFTFIIFSLHSNSGMLDDC